MLIVPNIASLPNGNWMVIWKQVDSDNNSIKAQIFDSARLKIGAEIIVACSRINIYEFINITSLNNIFIVKWITRNPANSVIMLEGSYFTATGELVERPAQIDESNADVQVAPRQWP